MNSELVDFIQCLSTHDPEKLTSEDIKLIRWYIKTDGCTGVPDFYLEECIKHDFYYRTHVGFDGRLISRSDADKLFRQGIQRKSFLGVLSPMAWWRWLFVRLLAARAWERRTGCI